MAKSAVLNYTSEIGFFCNPEAGDHVDPNTGINYLAEVQHVIEAQGFYPISAGAASGTVNNVPIDMGTVPHPASGTHQLQYSPYDPVTTDPNTGVQTGFCHR